MNLIVREEDLNFGPFRCCGDEDLHPFRCNSCEHVMVFCYECDSLYADLKDVSQRKREVNHFDPERPIFSCPRCGFAFEYNFMANAAYQVTRRAWVDAGHRRLLRDDAV